jgi:D-alanyl-D-alanine carboxypeptidase
MKRTSPFLIPLIVAVIITAILGVILIALEIGEKGETRVTEAPETEAPETEAPRTPPDPTFKADVHEYEEYMNATDEKYLILVNKQNTIDGSFEPEELVPVADAKKSIELSKTAEMALEAMFCEMRAEGFNDVFVTSAYRSYSYQTSLFNTYINDEMSRGLSYEEAKKKVLTYSAYPGTSEHHTGLCVDLMTTSMTELDESFADYPVYEWLLENAWKFGFILRYPEDKTEITGYSFEPWHYRFVGREHAYAICSEGLCLEEYVGKSDR